jgi:Bacillus/Clostridium GerA spore germination protein.
MAPFSSGNKEKIVNQKVDGLNGPVQDMTLDKALNKNVAKLRALFQDVDVLIVRFFQNAQNSALKFCIAYCDGLVNSSIMNESIIKPLMLAKSIEQDYSLTENLIGRVVLINDVKKTSGFTGIVDAITYGDTILFADGMDEAIILSTKGFQTRPVSEPENEKILSGPREGFTESLIQNLSMIHRRLRTNELKMKYLTMGRISKTRICVCYIDSVVNKDILNELFKRMKTIDIDAVLDANYITELIKDSPFSPFRSTGYTERPDVIVGKLLEGRIAVFLDGTPVVLTVPYLFIENFQSSEDYYLSFYYTSFTRLLRIFGFFLTITVPGFYVAIVAYNQEMMPTPLLISIAAARRNVPLPAALEAFLMLIVFDILQETGIRMPTGVGQALSIVGALVIGQAAVDAKLVAAPMIIVIGLTGITGLLVPKLNAPIIYLRFFLLLLATSFGLFGFIIGLCCILIHVINLTSFGVQQFIIPESLQFQEIKDTYIRAPWWTMATRFGARMGNKKRMNTRHGG